MNILVIGKSGQLARELARMEQQLTFWGREEIKKIDSNLIDKVVDFRPCAIINAAAYTAVEKAESEIEETSILNESLPAYLAQAGKALSIPFVHVSTDYVFNGSASSPYKTSSISSPLGVYGKTKADGEIAVLDKYRLGSCIIRTSWVYSKFGNNFVKTMLKLLATKSSINVVCDQIGTPTWAAGLAEASLFAAKRSVNGIHHWTDLGVASWFDFAFAIKEIGLEQGILEDTCEIIPVPTSAFPTKAQRPKYSVLDKESLFKNFKQLSKQHWRVQLRKMMESI